jgi:Cu/Ag efflux pump CusA
MTAVPGTSLEESLRLGGRVSAGLLGLPYVRSVSQRAGRAEKGEETRGTNASEMDLDLKASVKVASPESRIREVLSEFPGAAFSVNTFLTERIEETISGYLAPVVVNIFGDDLDVLDRKAGEVARVLGEVPGAREVMVQSPAGAPQLVADLTKWEVARWGFDPVTVLDAVSTAYDGKTVGQVYDRGRVFDVRVIMDPVKRENIAGVGSLPLRSAGGAYVRLGQLARIYEKSGRSAVLHDGGRRVQAVTCSVQGRSVGSFVADARKRILDKVSFPEGTYAEFTGSAEAEARSRRDLLVHSLLAGVGIILLLSIVLASYRNVLLVLLNLPFALVGSVLIVLATGGTLSIGSMVGFVTIFGITLRNSIMMLSHFEHLVSVEGMSWGPQAALRGASERLAPIVMTASVTALGLLPLALASGTAGREIEGPMAVAILGGLVTSTLLNLLVLPALALRFGRFGKEAGRSPEI